MNHITNFLNWACCAQSSQNQSNSTTATQNTEKSSTMNAHTPTKAATPSFGDTNLEPFPNIEETSAKITGIVTINSLPHLRSTSKKPSQKSPSGLSQEEQMAESSSSHTSKAEIFTFQGIKRRVRSTPSSNQTSKSSTPKLSQKSQSGLSKQEQTIAESSSSHTSRAEIFTFQGIKRRVRSTSSSNQTSKSSTPKLSQKNQSGLSKQEHTIAESSSSHTSRAEIFTFQRPAQNTIHTSRPEISLHSAQFGPSPVVQSQESLVSFLTEMHALCLSSSSENSLKGSRVNCTESLKVQSAWRKNTSSTYSATLPEEDLNSNNPTSSDNINFHCLTHCSTLPRFRNSSEASSIPEGRSRASTDDWELGEPPSLKRAVSSTSRTLHKLKEPQVSV